MQTSKAGTWTSNRAAEGSASRAFTLVELAVVLIVLGISATLVFPKLNGLLLREPEPWRSGRKLARLAKYARERAIATESTSVLSINANTRDYWVAGQQHDKESADVMVPSDLRGRLGEDVSITNVESTGEDWDPQNSLIIEFSPEGGCDPVTVSLTSSDGRTVSVVIGEWFDEIDVIGDNPAG